MSESPSKKRKTSGHGRHQTKWETLKGKYEGWIQRSEKGPEYSFCVPCRQDVKVLASGFYDLESHFESNKHEANVRKLKTYKPLDQHFSPSTQEKSPKYGATSAEVMFAQFLAEHNIPPTAGDHFTQLVKHMFPDSRIAKVRFCCYFFPQNEQQKILHVCNFIFVRNLTHLISTDNKSFKKYVIFLL